jgi:hypothetical protein
MFLRKVGKYLKSTRWHNSKDDCIFSTVNTSDLQVSCSHTYTKSLPRRQKVATSQETACLHYKTSQLMLLRVIIAFNSEKRTKYTNTFYGHKAEFLILKKVICIFINGIQRVENEDAQPPFLHYVSVFIYRTAYVA